jgi:hypothetical protein
MNYIATLGSTWGFLKIGANMGLIAKHAVAKSGSQVFWMGQSNFFMLGGGGPQVLPCTVWDQVFENLNTPFQSTCWAWSNTPFNEIWFFFPRKSTGATTPDFYAKFNWLSGEWDYGPLDRSCGIDAGPLGMPIAASSASLIYQHETSPDGDGQAIDSYFITGDFQLTEGQDILFVDWVIPDMKFGLVSNPTASANMQLTIFSQYFPGGATTTYGPFPFTSSTTTICVRVRGRLLSYKLESNDIGSFWRTGGLRIRAASDGRWGGS